MASIVSPGTGRRNHVANSHLVAAAVLVTMEGSACRARLGSQWPSVVAVVCGRSRLWSQSSVVAEVSAVAKPSPSGTSRDGRLRCDLRFFAFHGKNRLPLAAASVTLGKTGPSPIDDGRSRQRPAVACNEASESGLPHFRVVRHDFAAALPPSSFLRHPVPVSFRRREFGLSRPSSRLTDPAGGTLQLPQAFPLESTTSRNRFR